MRFVGVVGLAMLVGLGGGAGAVAEEGWDGFLATMSAYEETLALSQEFAGHLRNGDGKAVSKLAGDVREALGEPYVTLVAEGFSVAPGEEEVLDAWARQIVPLGLFADEAAVRGALENMRSCPMAGILLRNLILQVVDDGRAYRVEADRVVVDGTGSDVQFAVTFARCQLLERAAWTPAPVGYHVDVCRPEREDCPEIEDR